MELTEGNYNNFLTIDDELDIEKISDFVRNKWKDNNYEDLKIKIRDKYRIISLFVDPEHRPTIRQQERNHSTLKKNKMTYLVSEAFVKLFLSVCKLYANPIDMKPEDQTRMNPGAFRRLIEGIDHELEEQQEIIEKLQEKNLKGYMLESDHEKLMDKKTNECNEYTDQVRKLERKLEEQEKYYKEKLNKVNQRHQKSQEHLSKQIQDKATIDQSIVAKEIVNYDTDDSTD